MIINSLVILDNLNKEANSYNFSRNNNIIFSENNSQGKSTLLKFLYFTLGFDVRQFPMEFDRDKLILQASVSIGSDEYVITRKNNLYFINDIEGHLNVKEYSEWLQEKLKIEMKLPNTITRELFNAYASAVILPFYIDQDDSWDEVIYKNVSDTLKQYRDIPLKIMEYVLGLSSNIVNKLEIEKKSIEKDNNNLKQIIKGINEALIQMSEEDEYNKFNGNVSSQSLAKDIEYYINIQNDKLLKIKNYKIKALTKRSQLDKLKLELSEVKKIIKSTGERLSDIENECQYCHSRLTNEQMLSSLNLDTNLIELNLFKIELEAQIGSLQQEILELHISEEQLIIELRKIESKIKKTQVLKNIDDAVKQEANIVATQHLRDLVGVNSTRIESNKSKIKNLNKLIEEHKQNLKLRREDISKEYLYFLSTIQRMIPEINSEELEFLQFKKIDGSGMIRNRKFLGYYLTYIQLLKKYSVYNIPLCMDSFIKNEIDEKNEIELFSAINRFFFDENFQTFFSVIGRNYKYLKNEEKFHIVNIGSKLLTREKYNEVSAKLEIFRE
ncbi:hypothetical protein [Facklamia lactis]|uniref:hypothetical protein n=1 Tax=Facklamia lactis TaxID=2749967 RepID=UPI0018CD0A3C|nr:hypothetical protein [Facklamia lactis]MBG9979435.1 hypothetical protein [Facklamia lactis]